MFYVVSLFPIFHPPPMNYWQVPKSADPIQLPFPFFFLQLNFIICGSILWILSTGMIRNVFTYIWVQVHCISQVHTAVHLCLFRRISSESLRESRTIKTLNKKKSKLYQGKAICDNKVTRPIWKIFQNLFTSKKKIPRWVECVRILSEYQSLSIVWRIAPLQPLSS